MKIVIDADACPVTDVAIKIANDNSFKTVLVCDTAHIMNKEGVEVIVVDKGADSADFRIVNLLQKGDIAITQDYGLAAMCLAKGAFCLNQNGLIFDKNNIDGLLLARHNSAKMRKSGVRTKGPKKRTKENDEDFILSFNSLITASKLIQNQSL